MSVGITVARHLLPRYSSLSSSPPLQVRYGCQLFIAAPHTILPWPEDNLSYTWPRANLANDQYVIHASGAVFFLDAMLKAPNSGT